ncbi:hypothetical protein C8Q76DRAFT_143883 [Earliella scabrosa]|nr:hypothetical protein C8Q76DRAFT_143883 [Earliella scabrosa]
MIVPPSIETVFAQISATLVPSSPPIASAADLPACSALAAELFRFDNLSPQSTPSLHTSSEPTQGSELANTLSLVGELVHITGKLATAPLPGARPRDSTGAQPTVMSFTEFARLVRAAPPHIRALPVTRVESYQKPDPGTAGVFGHQYVLVGVLLPRAPPCGTQSDVSDPANLKESYLRFDLHTASARTVQWDGPVVLRVQMHDEQSALARDPLRLLSMSLPLERLRGSGGGGVEVAQGPSLDALAMLCELVQARVGRGYGMLGRNCIWLNDLMVFGMARKFGAHWMAHARLEPEGTMRRFMRGEINVIRAGTECSVPNETARWFAVVTGTAVRGIQAMLTAGDADRFLMHDDEVNEVLGAWRGYVPATLP